MLFYRRTFVVDNFCVFILLFFLFFTYSILVSKLWEDNCEGMLAQKMISDDVPAVLLIAVLFLKKWLQMMFLRFC